MAPPFRTLKEWLHPVVEQRSCLRILFSASCLLYVAGWGSGLTLGKQVPYAAPSAAAGGMFQIFLHNLAAMAPAAAGLVTFGVTTIFSLLFQGAVAGAAVGSASTELSGWAVAFHIVPHGIFEVPALLLWGTAGFSSLGWAYQRMRGHRSGSTLWGAALGLLAIGIVLLFFAAIIESAESVALAANASFVPRAAK
ncbi:MAG: stage II sporulation protein M [Firmicutes bacterium]|nr:stage II sporulation protein M [Bacillota bacterium]